MANIPVKSSLDFGGTVRILSLPPSAAADQPVIQSQLQAVIEGLNWKDNVRVDSSSNINLSSPGATINSIAMAIGDRFLVRAQTTASQNGIYIWNGSSVAATRAVDADAFDELKSAVVVIDEGPNAGSCFRQTAVNGTINTTAIDWASFVPSAPAANESTAGIMMVATQTKVDAGTDDSSALTPLKLSNWSKAPKRYTATIGDGSATQYTITHNLNTRDIDVTIRETTGNYRLVWAEVRFTTVNTINVIFDTAPAPGAYQVSLRA